MNQVTAFGDYNEMRDYKLGNMHGLYATQYGCIKGRAVYSYLTTGIPNQRCPILPTHDNFKTVAITNIHASARVEAHTTAGNNPTGPPERKEVSSLLSHPNNQIRSASTPNPSMSLTT